MFYRIVLSWRSPACPCAGSIVARYHRNTYASLFIALEHLHFSHFDPRLTFLQTIAGSAQTVLLVPIGSAILIALAFAYTAYGDLSAQDIHSAQQQIVKKVTRVLFGCVMGISIGYFLVFLFYTDMGNTVIITHGLLFAAILCIVLVMTIFTAFFYIDMAKKAPGRNIPLSFYQIIAMMRSSITLIILQIPALVLWGCAAALYMLMASINLLYLQQFFLRDHAAPSSVFFNGVWYAAYGIQSIFFWNLFVAVLYVVYHAWRRNNSFRFLAKDNVPGMILDEIIDDLLDM